MKSNITTTKAGKLLMKYKALAFIILIFVIMIFPKTSFYSLYNMMDLLKAVTIYAVCAAGVTFTVIAAGCDLSIGHNMTLSGIVCIMLMPYLPLFLCVLIALAIGALIGFIQGYLCVYWRTEPFIITLGVDMALRGICQQLTNATPVPGTRMEFMKFGNGKLFGVIPNIAVVMLIVIGVCYYLLRYTAFGRNLYAIGGDYEVAVYSGIKVIRTKWIAFVISGFTAALAGILLSARMNSGSSLYGETTALLVNCGCVIGGTSFAGGQGGMIETAIGIFLFTLVENALNLAGINAYVQQLVKGLLIVAVIAVDCYEQKVKAETV